MKLTALLCLLLCFVTASFSQSMGTPEDIVKGLKSGGQKIQLTLAKQLGLTGFDPQQNFRDCDVSARDAKLDESNNTSVLQVQCGSDLNIVVLRYHDAVSESLDTKYFYVPYDYKVELASVLRPSTQEIIIHNAATVSGNLYEAYFIVLRLTKFGKLEVVLSSLETGMEPHVGGTPRDEKSTFTIIAASATDSGEIHQVATIEIGSHSYTIRRIFEWSDEWQRFVETGIEGIQAHMK